MNKDSLVNAIEDALDFGNFIYYNRSYGFVSALEEVKNRIDKLIKSNPERAFHLYEIFIAGCYEKADEIDDSDGSLGQFVEDLFCAWIKAHQAAGHTPEATVKKLLSWIENDDYGFCYKLWKHAVKVFNRKSLKAFRLILENRSLPKVAKLSSKKKSNQKHQTSHDFPYDIDMLKSVYIAQKDIKAYLNLCDFVGLEPEDCEFIAGIYQAKKKFEDALEWLERAIELASTEKFINYSGYQLEETRRQLLKLLNKNEEALTSAWSEYENHPSTDSYDELMEYVPKKDKGAWCKKAISFLEKSPLRSAIEVYLKTKEINLLAKRIMQTTCSSIEDISHYTTEPAAKKLMKSHPLASAKLYQCLGFRIVNSKKSKYYCYAHEHFQKAKDLYEKEGNKKEWLAIVEKVRANHSRKSSFIGEFERITAGKGLRVEPAFLDRIQKRLNRYS